MALSDLTPCRLCWESESCLLVTWGSTVRVIEIRNRRGRLDAVISTGTLVAGAVPFGEDLALLW